MASSTTSCAEDWRKSSYSAVNGNCLEWAFRKSTYSTGHSECAEVAPLLGAVAVRDSKDPGGPVLEFSPAVWQVFLAGVKGLPTPG